MKKRTLHFIVITIMTVSYSGAQNGLWSPDGTDTVKTGRFVKINNSARIEGNLTVDNLKVKNMTVIGDPLTISWSCPSGCPVTRPFTASYLAASENAVVLEGGFPTAALAVRDNIRYGIGYFPLASGPVGRLHLNDNRTILGLSTNVFQMFTNFSTGSSATDGYRTGVTGGAAANAGHALLHNQETGKHILMQLSSGASGGNVGIDGAFTTINYPKRKLDVIDDGTGTAGGRPQLRLTQTPDLNATLGNFTDFQTTSLGDLAINPRSAGVQRNVGININNPANTLEINSPSGVLTSTGSGLKFTDVNNTVVPPANPTAGVLSLDNAGNVIWVQGGGGSGTGDVIACSSSGITTNYLPKWSPASNKELCNSQFIDDGTFTGISTLGPPSLFFAPTNVTSGVYSNAGHFSIGGSSTAFISYSAVQATANITSATSQIYGVRADVSGGGGSQNYGILGLCNGSGFNFGGYFSASGGSNYGIYATVVPNTAGLAGYFDGDVVRTGTDNFTSDSMFKENVATIANGWQVISQLNPRQYNFKTSQYPFMGMHAGLQYGFIAQEVEDVLPQLVGSAVHPERLDSSGALVSPSVTYKTLNYMGLIPFLVKTVQEQQAQIDSLMNNNARFQSGAQNLPTQSITLTSKSCMLFQNVPNPFGEVTSISYYLPESVMYAEIVFYDTYGNEIHRAALHNRGKAKLDITAKELASGIYSYSLIADGKVVDTLKMIRTK